MMKYIIDIPDEAVSFMDGEMSFFVEPKIKDERRRHYVLRIDEEDVSIYTEPDRGDIEDEVWKFVRELIRYNNGKQLSYQEAKAKYDAWKKSKEEIHVGDEVVFGDRKGVVMGLDGDGVNIVWSDGSTVFMDKADILKTGKFFEWVGEFMEKMRGLKK